MVILNVAFCPSLRYEDLKKQLSDAQKQIQEENETRQLQAATEAVARLISPSPRSGPGDAAEEDEPKPARLLDLEARVAAAKDDHFRASSDEP